MLKVARYRSMLGQVQLLLQPARSSSSQVLDRDRARAFYGTCSTLLGEKGNIQLGCFSSKTSILRYGRPTLLDPKAFSGSQNVGRSSSFFTQTICSTGKAAKDDDVSILGSVMQRRSLMVEAARHHAMDGLAMGECEVTCGGIHLIIGPMFAGKTTALLERVEAEASAGRKVALVKSDKDTRYGLDSIVSHDGQQRPCWAVPSLANFRSQIGEDEYAKLDLIGIDEAQFLKDLCSFCQTAADYEGKTLIVAGLDGDFQRNKFGSILDLIPLADSIVKLSAHCELCGKPAAFTFRKTDDRSKEIIGGTDIYMPVCRQHYYSGQVALEATRTVLDSHKFSPLKSDNVDKNKAAL